MADQEVGHIGDAQKVLLAGGEPAGLVGDDVLDALRHCAQADGNGVDLPQAVGGRELGKLRDGDF